MLKDTRVKLAIRIVAALLLISLVAVAAIKPFNAKASTAFSSSSYGAAPYVMPLANNPPSLTDAMSASGVKAFTLAFVVANGGCTPAWEADAGLDNVSSDTQIAPIINGVRSAGGDVVVSFGGYGGTKLGQTCGSAQATADAEQTVISKYGLHAIDLDLEEPEYENANAINNELGAAKILQANNPGLFISITIPGTTSGTGYYGCLYKEERSETSSSNGPGTTALPYRIFSSATPLQPTAIAGWPLQWTTTQSQRRHWSLRHLSRRHKGRSSG